MAGRGQKLVPNLPLRKKGGPQTPSSDHASCVRSRPTTKPRTSTSDSVIPLRDENPTELTPYFTVIFLLLNIAAWVLIQGAGSMVILEASVVDFGVIPCRVTGAC